MSSGPNITSFGAKLGSLPQNWGFLNPGSYMSTAQPFPTGAFANWKPAGTAALEGIGAGTQLGKSIAEMPSQLKQQQLQTQLTGAQAKEAEAEAAQKLAQIGMMQYQMEGGVDQATGKPLAGPGALPISENVDKILGTQHRPATNPVPVQTATAATPAQGNVTVGAPVQTPSPVSGAAQGVVQGLNAGGETTATGNTGGTPIAAGSGTTTLGAGQTPTPSAPEKALGGLSLMQQQYAKDHPGQTMQDQAANQFVPQENQPGSQTVVNPSGRLPALDSKGNPLVVNGVQLYQNDDGRGGMYMFEPLPNGEERRFPTVGTWDERKNGYVVQNPQAMQINLMRQELTGSPVTPQQVGYPQGTTWADVGNNPGDGVKMANAMHIVQNTKALQPADGGTVEDLESKRVELQRGDDLLAAMEKLSPQDYNGLSSSVYNLVNKYGTTPGLGQAIMALSGQKGINPAQSKFFSDYNAYLNAARLDTTGKMRSTPEEFKALVGSFGSPQENNWDFKDRFGNILTQKRINYVNQIDNLPIRGQTLMPLNPNGTYKTVAQVNNKNAPASPEYNTPYDPKTNPYYIPEPLKYRDALEPIIRADVQKQYSPRPVTTGQTQATPQAQPSQTPAIQLKSPQDLSKVPLNSNIVINGKQGKATPELFKKYGITPAQ